MRPPSGKNFLRGRVYLSANDVLSLQGLFLTICLSGPGHQPVGNRKAKVFGSKERNESGRPYRSVWVMSGTISALLLLIFIGLVSNGCEKHTRYQVLSTLFDGVPDPDAPPPEEKSGNIKLAKGAAKSGAELSTKTYRHPPAEGSDDCTFCHGKNMMVQPPKDLCIRCHTHVQKNLKVVHPPTAKSCSICHDPHDGPSQFLLRKLPPELCVKCHDKGAPNKPCSRVEAKDADCLSCHEPHGGDDKFYLVKKEDVKEGPKAEATQEQPKNDSAQDQPKKESVEEQVKGKSTEVQPGKESTQEQPKDGNGQDGKNQEQPKSEGG